MTNAKSSWGLKMSKMTIKKRHIYALSRQITRYLFFIFVFLAVIQTVFIFAEYFSKHPECMSIRQLANPECFREEYVWNTMQEKPPPELTHKAEMLNDARNMILFALLYFCLYEIVLYLENPNEHWIIPLIRKISASYKKVEDD